MKTTVDIPEKGLREAMVNTGARTKQDAVARAIAEFNRGRRLDELADELGTFDHVITLEELRTLREAD